MNISYDTKWDYKNISLLLALILLPNLLGMINLPTPWGFKIHFFQIAVFIAAITYGPKAGFLSGMIGSMYSAFTMSNPYIMIGNAILGLFTGYFAKKGVNTVLAVLLAFIIQLPWLILTDYYLVGLPIGLIASIIVSLTISNITWAVIAKRIVK